MPVVTIKILAPMSEQLGLAKNGKRATIEMTVEPGACIRSVITQLAQQYPAFSQIALELEARHPVSLILLTHNGQLISSPAEYDRPVKERDKIMILPRIVGG